MADTKKPQPKSATTAGARAAVKPRTAEPKAPPSLRPTGRKAAQTYDALVAATCDVIVATGSLSGEAVAEKAGMATATFYAYFSTKEDALGAAFEAVVSEVNASVEPLLGVERLLDHGLRSVLHDVVVAMLRNFRRNAPIYRLGLASLPDNERMRTVWRYHEHVADQYIKRFVRYGSAAGKIRSDDTDRTAVLLLVLLQGLNNHSLVRLTLDDPVVERYCDVLERTLTAD